MLQDFVHLPIRYPTDATIDTETPFFVPARACEVVESFGRCVDVGYLSERVHKYKSVENVGSSMVERMFLVAEPIDFRKSWHTAATPAYPISAKVYSAPYTVGCEVYRYLGPITHIVNELVAHGYQLTTGNSIHLLTLLSAEEYGYVFPPKARSMELCHRIVYGDDSSNLERYASVLAEDPADGGSGGWVCDIMPPASTDPSHAYMSTPGLTVGQIAKISSPDFGKYALGLDVCKDDTPFDVDESTNFCADLTVSASRPLLHDLLTTVDFCPLTDFSVTVQPGEKTKFVGYSRYVGRTLGTPAQDQLKDTLAAQLLCWANTVMTYYRGTTIVNGRVRGPRTMQSVTLIKNWNEEVFIEISTDKDPIRYYVDLTMYALCTLSIV